MLKLIPLLIIVSEDKRSNFKAEFYNKVSLYTKNKKICTAKKVFLERGRLFRF
jgi:hypothetical protein